MDEESAGSIPETTQSPSADTILISDETQVPEIVDECFSCHTDKQALIDSAKPVVVVEAESSGEG